MGAPDQLRHRRDPAQDHRRGEAYLQEYPINTNLDDPSLVRGDTFRSGLGVTPDQQLLVGVPRLAEWMKQEGIARTIEVVGNLASTHDLVLAVGDGDARAELEELGGAVNRRAGRKVVRFTGALADPRPAYAAADISLGMGTSIVRAMAFGRPGIVLGEEGFAETFTPDTVDLLCDQGFYGLADSVGANDRLAAQLRALLDEHELRDKLGELSRDLVVSRFAASAVAADLVRRYRQVQAAKPDRSPQVMARAAAQAAVLASTEPIKRFVPQRVKFQLQRRDQVRINPAGTNPLQGAARP